MTLDKRDHSIMFVVSYEDGQTAYITVRPTGLEHGDHVVRGIVRERQGKGEIPEGEIKVVKRVR